jgi:hypothetical protein
MTFLSDYSSKIPSWADSLAIPELGLKKFGTIITEYNDKSTTFYVSALDDSLSPSSFRQK